MKRTQIILIAAVLCGCNNTKTYKPGDDPIQACEDVAKATEKLLGDGDESSAAYRLALNECQVRISEDLTEIGAGYANCVLGAESGSAIQACNKDTQQDFLDEKVKMIEEISVEVWKDICKGNVADDDPRLKKVTRIENDARQLGFTQADTNALLERVREKSGCNL